MRLRSHAVAACTRIAGVEPRVFRTDRSASSAGRTALVSRPAERAGGGDSSFDADGSDGGALVRSRSSAVSRARWRGAGEGAESTGIPGNGVARRRATVARSTRPALPGHRPRTRHLARVPRRPARRGRRDHLRRGRRGEPAECQCRRPTISHLVGMPPGTAARDPRLAGSGPDRDAGRGRARVLRRSATALEAARRPVPDRAGSC